jgi:hypothetical protein
VRLQKCAAMRVDSVMSMLGLVLGLVVGLLFASVAISKAKPVGGPTAENALAAEQEIARAMANNARGYACTRGVDLSLRLHLGGVGGGGILSRYALAREQALGQR